MSQRNPFADLDALRTAGNVEEFQRWVQGTPNRPGKSTRKKEQAFTMLPLQWAADTAKAAKTPGAMVWVLLSYMAWKTKSATFPLSNMLLARYGINRKTKQRILVNLEKAGRIKIQRRGKQAPIVTLLVMPT